MEILIAIGVFGLVWGFLFLLLSPKAASEEEVVQKRMATIAASSEGTSSRPQPDTDEEGFWEYTAKFFLGEQELAGGKQTAMHRLLHQAGYPGDRAVRVFWGVRIFLAIACAAGAFLLTAFSQAAPFKMLLGVSAGVAVGYILPFSHVRRKARFRTRDIQEAFPDTLDLLVTCVEAGLGLDGALVRVAREQADQRLAIGDEFQMLSREMQAGITRRDALARMSDRLDLEDLRNLAVFLIQTEELGGSIARSLKVYATTMRQKRKQRAEEAARKMVIKLLFPLALFIMPALLLVVLGPPAINIMRMFVGFSGR
jgi:tight adherence protein C